MAVINTEQLKFRPFQMATKVRDDHPELPWGILFGTRQQAGDASGGGVRADFQLPTELRLEGYWSIMGASHRRNDNPADTTLQFDWIPGEVYTDDGGNTIEMAFRWNGNLVGSATIGQAGTSLSAPYNGMAAHGGYIARPKINPPTVPVFRVQSINVNLIVYVSTCWGYYWQLQAGQVPGGPRLYPWSAAPA